MVSTRMARQPSLGFGPIPRITCSEAETDASDVDLSGTERSRDRNSFSGANAPLLFHKVRDERSILALVATQSKLFAGTQGGEILVWSLNTYELLARIWGHQGAVLGLCLSQDGAFLFSCAGDAIINVWNTLTLKRVYSLYSTYDVGDVFCAVYSSSLETLYFGAQNTSIQWYDFSQKDSRPTPDLQRHPSYRNHRFFDSKGPGGISTPRPDEAPEYLDRGGKVLEIDKTSIVQYAHFGYVYCMALCRGLNQNLEEETLVTGGGDGTIKLWSLARHKATTVVEKAILENGDNSILTIALNQTVLYAGRLEGEVNVWDLETRQLIRSFKAYDADVLTLTIGHGVVFTGGAEGKAKLYERYKCKHEWKAHEELILASIMVVHNEKPYLITGGNDDCVAIWDMTDSLSMPTKSSKPSAEEQLIQSLGKFVAFRTVSSMPEYAEDCRQGASWLRNLFRRYGASTEMLSTDDNCNPVVLARFKGKTNGGKRILFYGHYDVIAAENEQSKWMTHPFTMEGRDGYLYGRGVSDNKGPLLAAIFAVADLVTTQKLESDIVFLIEGEEECGSRGFESAVKRNKAVIGEIDWILLANSYWLNDELPCLTYGLRGALHATISVEGGQEDLHSGVNGSNLMSEPLKDLVTLVAKLTDCSGRVAIPGFYDCILPISTAEERRYKTISEILLRNGSEHENLESLKARWAEPSLTMHGFKTSGSGNSTIIPHHASIALSFRLVPNQSAADIKRSLVTFLHSQWKSINTSNRLSVSIGHSADPWLGNPENDIYAALQEAIIDVWALDPTNHHGRSSSDNISSQPSKEIGGVSSKANRRRRKSQAKVDQPSTMKEAKRESGKSKALREPLYIREGGSIPTIRFLEKELVAPAAQLPCGQSSDSAHLDNERLRVLNLYNSRRIFRRVFAELPMR